MKWEICNWSCQGVFHWCPNTSGGGEPRSTRFGILVFLNFPCTSSPSLLRIIEGAHYFLYFLRGPRHISYTRGGHGAARAGHSNNAI